MDLTLTPLVKNDPELSLVKKLHEEPTVARFISVSDDYFDYVTSAENVVYYKIKRRDELVGGLHTETENAVLYLSICIQPLYRRQGLAAAALKKLISQLPPAAQKIQVSIDEANAASLRLFESLGFSNVGREEELVDYILTLR